MREPGVFRIFLQRTKDGILMRSAWDKAEGFRTAKGALNTVERAKRRTTSIRYFVVKVK